jgi:cation diffusion facilitator CzcD-associated flavoprotein CzcO
MTLVPAMAATAAHVTMLQRSPTYVVARPDSDSIAITLRKFLPQSWAYGITRWKNTTMQQFVYKRTRTKPEQVKDALLKGVRDALGEDYDVETHFTPSYNPWDQRLCLVPNGDLFTSIKEKPSIFHVPGRTRGAHTLVFLTWHQVLGTSTLRGPCVPTSRVNMSVASLTT